MSVYHAMRAVSFRSPRHMASVMVLFKFSRITALCFPNTCHVATSWKATISSLASTRLRGPSKSSRMSLSMIHKTSRLTFGSDFNHDERSHQDSLTMTAEFLITCVAKLLHVKHTL